MATKIVQDVSMTTVESSLSADSATGTGRLFDIGDGILLGTVSYFIVSLLAFVTSELFIQFIEGNSLLFGLLALFLLLVSLRSISVIRSTELSFTDQVKSWRRKRRWRWLFAASVVIFVILFGGTLFVGGWRLLAFPLVPAFISNIVALLGFTFRIVGRHRDSTKDE